VTAARMTVKGLHDRIGITPDTPGYGKVFGQRSKAALFAVLSNCNAPALTDADFKRVADDLGVSVKMIRAVRKVEAPRGAFDDMGRPSILYERHVFARNCDPAGCHNTAAPVLSASKGYGPGGYGPFDAQYDRLALACGLDPHAAFSACSWGAFQVLGENWEGCGYASPFDMALALTVSEAAHLDSFARFVRMKRLEDELRACRPGDPESCVPFVRGYNGTGYKAFNYHVKLAQAAL
jgi:hypothetical protein